MKRISLLLAIAFLLTSCQAIPAFQPTATPTATSTPTPTNTPEPTATPTSTPTPTQEPVANCSMADVVEKLNDSVPYADYSLSYNIYQGTPNIFFWIIDPQLNPLAKESELQANFDLAVKHAIELAYTFKQADRCTAQLFEIINPVVVDKNYNGWFSGLIEVEELPNSGELTEKDIKEIQASIIERGAWRRKTVPDVKEIPAGSCSWKEVRDKVSRHFGKKPINTYMLVSDNDGMAFTVQYQAQSVEDEIVVFLNTAREVSCVQPPVQTIVIILVNKKEHVISAKRLPLIVTEPTTAPGSSYEGTPSHLASTE